MRRNKESAFIAKMYSGGIMPIFFDPNPEICVKIIQTAYDAGIRVIEMVNRGKEAPDIFPEVRKAADSMTGLSLGIGTIYHGYEAEKFLDIGAEFIVSPVMCSELGEYCKRNETPWVPGCATVTEVFQAQELGAELVKIYPANILTPAFVKAVHAVLPSIEIIPTGGVEPTSESMTQWLDAGVCCLGMGSQLISKSKIANGDFETIQKEMKRALEIVADYRLTR